MVLISQRHRRTDRQLHGQTDDMQTQYCALHYSASRGYNMQVKQQVPAHSKILPAEIWHVDELKNTKLVTIITRKIITASCQQVLYVENLVT